MKLLVYSDLHLDLYPFKLHLELDFLKTVDVVVLAGDTTEGTSGLRWARETFPDQSIIYVDGNHEFYGQHWDKHIDVMRKLAQDHEVHYLENDAVVIDGVRGIVVDLRLRDLEPLAYKFVVDFARDNNLKTEEREI